MSLLEKLCSLEIALHQPEIRLSTERLEALLHDSFIEIGRSGRSYRKAGIIKQLLLEKTPSSIWSQDFSVEEISEGIVFLMYKSAHMHETGELTQHTNRTSLWQHTSQGWQLRFHQGTVTDAFEAKSGSRTFPPPPI